jgi:hypothetical protein
MRSKLMIALMASCCIVAATTSVSAAAPDGSPSHGVVLEGNGLHVTSFGATAATATRAISAALGDPTGHPSAGCSAAYTQTAWHDLIVQFVSGRFRGYRFVVNGNWKAKPAPKTLGSATPKLSTAAGIALGDTLAGAKRAYPSLRQTGTDFWRTSSGIVFAIYNPTGHTSPSAKIYEIKHSACPGSL